MSFNEELKIFYKQINGNIELFGMRLQRCEPQQVKETCLNLLNVTQLLIISC